MSNKIYYFSGMINWAKVHTPDTKYDVYTLDLYLDKESWVLFKDSGLQLKVRESDDGQYIKLRRPVSKKTRNGLEDMGPPEVLLRQEDGTYRPTKALVGNGSTGVCKVRVYDTDKGKGHELQTVAVENLVIYEESIGGEDYPF